MRRSMRFAARLLAKNTGFSIVAVFALALGIGPNTAIFSVIYANLFAPLPYPQPDELVMIWSKINGERNQVSAADFLDWKRQVSSFQGMAAFSGQNYNLSSAQEPQYMIGERVSTNWYKLLGETVAMGRDFRPDEDQPGKDHVFILSHRSWTSKFGADPNIIGKRFHLNGEPYTAIGVMPPGRLDRDDAEIWVPLRFNQAEIARGATFWWVLGRLKPGTSIKQAQHEMDAVTRRIAELYPATNKNWGASVEPLKNDFESPSTRRDLWLLFGAVSCVLLIACVNVANLLLAHGAVRQRELAVRAAIGASRIRLVVQLLGESLMVAALGGALGILLSVALLKIILLILPAGTLSPETDVRLSAPVLLFTFVTTVLSAIFFGCAPAMQAAGVDVNEALKQGGRSAVGPGHVRLRQGLVIIQFALALTLPAGAALLAHSFVNRTHVDLGVRTDHILTFNLLVPQARVARPEQTQTFYHDLLARIEAVPDVQRAAAGTDTPLDESNFEMPFSIAGRPISDLASLPDAEFQAVTPGYFQTFGVRMAKGRVFNEQDTANSPRVAVVNETFARRFLGGVNPLSQRLLMQQLRNGALALGPRVEWQIVGVFHDIQNGIRVGEPKRPQIYVPFAQSPWPEAIVAVRTAMDPEKVRRTIEAAVHYVDPDLPLAEVKTMDQIVHNLFVADRFGVALYGSFAGIALILASLGIYGLMSFTVAQSTSEIGLRMALGATAGRVLMRTLRRGLAMAGAGLVLGFIGAYFAGRLMQSMLYGTGVIDWVVFCAVAVLLLIAALLACYVPARRASAVDPMVALHEG